MSVLGIITARGGSKRIPGKNVKNFCGKPLIAWTIDAARSARSVDRLILSSDSPEIMAVAEKFGCEVPFVRPPELATDEAQGVDPLIHAIDYLESQGESFDHVLLLQPTSPLRNTGDIERCCELYFQSGAPACVSVSELNKSINWTYSLGDGMVMKKVFEEPFEDQAYIINGAIYIARTDWLKKHRKFVTDETIAYVMPQERSVDIDTPLDFFLAEALAEWPG